MNDIAPIEQIRHTLVSMRPRIEATLANGMEFERFARHVMLNIERNKRLLRADRNSLLNAISQASASGLVPDGREGALAVFKNQVTWMPMYQGLLKLVAETTDLKSFSANIVREDDQFDYWMDGSMEQIMHRPKIGSRSPIVAAYAVATNEQGGTFVEVVDFEELEKIRMISQTGSRDQGPWRDWYDEMAKKTAIRRLVKRMPMSNRLVMQAAESVDQFYDFGNQQQEKEQTRIEGRPKVFDAITGE